MNEKTHFLWKYETKLKMKSSLLQKASPSPSPHMRNEVRYACCILVNIHKTQHAIYVRWKRIADLIYQIAAHKSMNSIRFSTTVHELHIFDNFVGNGFISTRHLGCPSLRLFKFVSVSILFCLRISAVILSFKNLITFLTNSQWHISHAFCEH